MSHTGVHEPTHRGPRKRNIIAAVFRRKQGSSSTPLFQWKFNRVAFSEGFGDGTTAKVSARKLAAWLWQLRLTEVSGGSDDGGSELRAFGCDSLHKSQRKAISFRHDSSLLHPRWIIEGATKWDADHSEASCGVPQIYNHKYLLENGQVVGNNVVCALKAELMEAQLCVKKLKAARNFSRKRIEHFLQRLEEEKNSWKNRERQKTQAAVDDLKNELERERKTRKKIEMLNSKLVNELTDAKQSEKKYVQSYEEEKRSREIMEEVCNELAKRIGEDRIEVEELKRGALEFQEELEGEREMLRMAELWREERVHMKLQDAKLALEDKYHQMNLLIRDLQAFLRSLGTDLNAEGLKKAELIQKAVKSMNIQEIKEFSYVPPEPGDMYSIIEELIQEGSDDRKIQPYLHSKATDHSLKTCFTNPQKDGLEKDYSYGFDVSLEQQGTLETIGRWQNDKNNDHLVCRIYNSNKMSGNKNEHNRIQELLSSDNGDSEICSVPTRQLKQRASSTTQFSLSPNIRTGYFNTASSRHGVAGESAIRSQDCVAPPSSPDGVLEEFDPGIFGGRAPSVGMTSPHDVSSQGDSRCTKLTMHQCSTESMNPHITRGMKGSIEWPRGVPKARLKTRLLESRIRNQKSQLQLILKNKNVVD